MVNGRLNQRPTAEIVNLARQDLSAGGAGGSNREVRKDAQHGIVRGVEQRIKSLRAALRSGRLTIRPLPFAGGTRRAVVNLVTPAAQSPRKNQSSERKECREEKRWANGLNHLPEVAPA
jgi:hypothetical protein